MFNGRKVKELRKGLNLTQEQLANEINLNKTSISYFERNQRTPSMDTIIDLSYALNTTPYYLMDAEKTLKIKDETEEYETFLSKKDLEIIKEIKKHNDFYNRLCENPKELIRQIIKKIY